MTGGGEPIAAGDFSPWLRETARIIEERGEADVPCGSCTACCTSSQFVHIGPDETATLARIPKALRFAAPGLPPGHVVLGYDERGHCPMLHDGKCSIYDDRPRTCRTYDCRVFAASGLDPASDAKPDIARRVAQWRFSFPTDADRAGAEAVRAAAAYLSAHPELLDEARLPATATQRAAVAVAIHEAFLTLDPETGRPVALLDPDRDEVRRRLRRF